MYTDSWVSFIKCIHFSVLLVIECLDFLVLKTCFENDDLRSESGWKKYVTTCIWLCICPISKLSLMVFCLYLFEFQQILKRCLWTIFFVFWVSLFFFPKNPQWWDIILAEMHISKEVEHFRIYYQQIATEWKFSVICQRLSFWTKA